MDAPAAMDPKNRLFMMPLDVHLFIVTLCFCGSLLRFCNIWRNCATFILANENPIP
jgi:hypothetical protein